MFILYPRLPIPEAESLWTALASADITTLAHNSAESHPGIQYGSTGGSRATTQHLRDLQKRVRECAREHGYPNQSIDDNISRRFDVKCGILLHQTMQLHPSEASHREIWAFMTCVLLPDVVRWRFYGGQTAIERFVGKDRGLRRNAFGRLWWRAFLLRQTDSEEPYRLLYELYEDDLVQVTERNSIAADSRLLTTFCSTFLRSLDAPTGIPRRTLMREASKRLRRLLSFVCFEAADTATVNNIVVDVFEKTITAVKGSSTGVADSDPMRMVSSE